MSDAPGATASEIEAAAAALRAGELVAFPTETVYGLGADARQREALRRIYALKGRPSTHPLILHIGELAELSQWVREVPDEVGALAARFWPGPLTLVLARAPGVLDELTGGQDSIAVRMPSHPVARALLAAFGSGIAAPSANRYGHVSPTCAAHVREEFPHGLRILEGGACEVGLESTILSFIGGEPRLLRPGVIGRRALEQALARALATDEPAERSAIPRVPGSTIAHYAPDTPLQLIPGDTLERSVHEQLARGERVAVLARRAAPAGLPAGVCVWLAAPQTAGAFGQALYANLRTLDKSGAGTLLVESVPTDETWEAVRDRLTRAAAGSSRAD